MNTKSILVVATIVLATSNAFAAGTPGSLDYPYFDNSSSSTVSRSSVRNDARVGNATHELTGEAGADIAVSEYVQSPSTVSRGQVRSDVLKARADGTLPRAGDLVDYPSAIATTPTGRFDAARHPRLAGIGHWFASLGKGTTTSSN